ncbi:MAG: hypothetical protein Q8Q20_04650 [bacterium]|nr:hypothetical protein [bacterium]
MFVATKMALGNTLSVFRKFRATSYGNPCHHRPERIGVPGD